MCWNVYEEALEKELRDSGLPSDRSDDIYAFGTELV